MDTNETNMETGTVENSAVEENPIVIEPPLEEAPSVTVAEPVKPAPAPAARSRKGLKLFLGILAALLTLCVVFGGCVATAVLMNRYWEGQMHRLNEEHQEKIAKLQSQISALEKTQIIVPGNEDGESVTLTPPQLYSLAAKGVVSVNAGSSVGSGFLVSADGYIVTNYHVVEDATSLKVTTYAEQEYTAKLVGYDNSNDLAVLKIEGEDMPYLTCGSSSTVNIGEQVAVIGSPLGKLTGSLNLGYISAKDRLILAEGSKIHMIQLDASINEGNSGGPLLNMQGQVIGIASAKYSGTTSSGALVEGIGFAIPIDNVSGMISDLMTYGYITGPYLGVMVRDVEDSVIQDYGLPAGAYVDSVLDGVSADRAGVQAKDIIVAIGDYRISCVSDLSRVLRNFKTGDTTTIIVYRSGGELELSITMDEKPRN